VLREIIQVNIEALQEIHDAHAKAAAEKTPKNK
jgi:hypothetical protein